jgi:Raf kinase inhibitor-like YbhB/YbcL family protein
MTSEPSATGTTDFVVRSDAFDDGGPIPRRQTCDGEDVSPEIAWSGAPAGTRSLALVVRDPDARGFVHWIVYDIPAAPEGRLPTGMSAGAAASPQGLNGFGRAGWGGPCPPSGTHHYVFTLYALDRATGLTGTPKLAALEAAMRNHVIAQATLTGTYKRS